MCLFLPYIEDWLEILWKGQTSSSSLLATNWGVCERGLQPMQDTHREVLLRPGLEAELQIG